MNLTTSRRRPSTLRGAARDGLLTALCLGAGGALGALATVVCVEAGLLPELSISYAAPTDSPTDSPADAPTTVDHTGTAASADPARALVTEYGCWTGAAPGDVAGDLPGHVVATPAASGEPTYSAALVGPALEQVFDGTDADLTVHAFCR